MSLRGNIYGMHDALNKGRKHFRDGTAAFKCDVNRCLETFSLRFASVRLKLITNIMKMELVSECYTLDITLVEALAETVHS